VSAPGRGLKVAILVATLLRSGPVAAGATRVVLVRPSEPSALLDEATTRVRAELVAAGFEVDVAAREPAVDARAQVEAAGAGAPSAVTLALLDVPGSAAADIWVADRVTGKTLVRHVDVRDIDARRAPAVLAVRAVELLRASLLEASAPEFEAEKHPIPPDVARWMAPPARVTPEPQAHAAARARPSFELGAAMLFRERGLTPAFAPLLRVGYGIESVSGRISVVAPAVGASVTTPDGSATVRQELATGELVLGWPRGAPFSVVVSAGGGVHHAHVAGSASPPLVAYEGEHWGAVFDAGLGAVLRLGPATSVVVDLQGLFFAPPLAVQIAGRDAAGTGSPALCTTAGLRGEL
jgi:hypothetical protein